MTGTLSRIPRGRNLVASQLESLGLGDEEPGGGTTGTSRVPQVLPMSSAAQRFSPELVTVLREALQRGDLTLPELRAALSSARLRSEDDIRRVLDHTTRLKRTIIALGASALLLMKRVHPDTVLILLKGWMVPLDAPAAEDRRTVA
jgi:hypothetical protein